MFTWRSYVQPLNRIPSVQNITDAPHESIWKPHSGGTAQKPFYRKVPYLRKIRNVIFIDHEYAFFFWCQGAKFAVKELTNSNKNRNTNKINSNNNNASRFLFSSLASTECSVPASQLSDIYSFIRIHTHYLRASKFAELLGSKTVNSAVWTRKTIIQLWWRIWAPTCTPMCK